MIRLDILLLFAFASFSTAVMAQEVSVDAAKSHVLEFLSNKTSGPMRAKGQQVSNDLELAYTSKSEAKTCFYVFNLGNDNGFVIAGGDESARQILGYCDHGSFDYDTANPAFKWWLGQYEEQIAHAEVPSASPRKAKASAEERSSIGPLISTSWSQRDPYNCEIPVYDSKGTPYLTGCAATAMAQIMNYWKYPDFGTGSNSFSRDGFEFSADFEHTLYDWDNMLDTYLYDEESGDPLFSSEEAKAVSCRCGG